MLNKPLLVSSGLLLSCNKVHSAGGPMLPYYEEIQTFETDGPSMDVQDLQCKEPGYVIEEIIKAEYGAPKEDCCAGYDPLTKKYTHCGTIFPESKKDVTNQLKAACLAAQGPFRQTCPVRVHFGFFGMSDSAGRRWAQLRATERNKWNKIFS